MKREFKIVIAGAGVVGLTLAALLSRSKRAGHLDITVIDAAPSPDFSIADDIGLRVSAIACGSAAILQQADAWSRLTMERICAYSDMRVWDARGSVDGPETLHFSASEYALPQLGFIAENNLLQLALLEALAARHQQVRFATTLRAIDDDQGQPVLSLSDGSQLCPDLLVGADGGNSFVRKQAGIGVKSWAYHQDAFVTHLQPERPHEQTAWQRFLPSGPVALLPLRDGRVSTVWSTTPEEAKSARAMSDTELSDVLSEKTDYVLGKLTPAGPRGSFPLHAQHAKDYVKQGLALIGDAAHSVHPLAGQGANLGIADAACLAATIESAMADNEFIGDYRVLRKYERARKGANVTMLGFIDGINRLFGARSPTVAAIRGTGMRLFNRSGPVRDHAVRVALGIIDR